MNNFISQSEQLSGISDNTEVFGFPIRYDSIIYRNQEINFLSDVSGVQCVAQWNNLVVDLGLNNIYYKEDMCRFIDRRLDLITEYLNFPELSGARLEWFHNGDYRDIKLSYKGRILKVFLVSDSVNIEMLIPETVKLLYTSGLLEEPN